MASFVLFYYFSLSPSFSLSHVLCVWLAAGDFKCQAPAATLPTAFTSSVGCVPANMKWGIQFVRLSQEIGFFAALSLSPFFLLLKKGTFRSLAAPYHWCLLGLSTCSRLHLFRVCYSLDDGTLLPRNIRCADFVVLVAGRLAGVH